MRNNVTAHPEALMNCICDVQAPLEAEGFRCKIMVMSSLCYASLLKEDHRMNEENRSVRSADAKDVLKHGYLGRMWGAVIYIDRSRESYDIDAYGDSCLELQIDHPDIWDKAQEIIALP